MRQITDYLFFIMLFGGVFVKTATQGNFTVEKATNVDFK